MFYILSLTTKLNYFHDCVILKFDKSTGADPGFDQGGGPRS